MKRFAANRVCLVAEKEILRNYVVEVDEVTHQVIRYFCLHEEIQQTEWKGGIILITSAMPNRVEGDSFQEFLDRISKEEEGKIHGMLCYAYHITAFDVNSMEFTTKSHILSL